MTSPIDARDDYEYRFALRTYPPRWWWRRWTATSTLVRVTDGTAEVDRFRRIKLTGYGDTLYRAETDVHRAAEAWVRGQRQRRIAARPTRHFDVS